MRNDSAHRLQRWTTSSFGTPPDTLPMELAELRAHLTLCGVKRRRWFALRCVGDALHDFMAPRVVTTLMLCSALIGLGLLLS